MIMTRNEDGTYSQVGFVKDSSGIDTEYIYDKDGDIVFEKGFTRETSGTVPLTINGIGKDLKDWSITGNTVQDGTPTPDTPQEVKAVGDRTGNLFNLQSWTNTATDTRSYFQLSITLYNGSTSLGECRFDVHETGRVVFTSATAGADGATRLAIKHNGSTRDLAIGSVYDDFPANQPLTISFDVSGYDPTIAGGISISNIMLNTGSTALPYEPYGYKIPVVTRGKNLLKLKEVNLTIRGVAVSIKNNSITVKGTAISNGGRTDYLSGSFVLQPGTYFISGDIVDKMVYCLTNKSNGQAVIASSSTSKFTLTEKTEVAFGLNFISGASYDATVNVMLNEGDKKLPYEPYHEPVTTPIYLQTPLYSGEVLKSDGSREVKVNKLVLTGSEDWKLHSINSYGIANFYISVKPIFKPNSKCFCTHFSAQKTLISQTTNAGVHLSESNLIYIGIKSELANTVSSFKSWLTEQYTAGTPVTIWYTLETPTTETFTAPQIPTLNGTTVIDVDTKVEPSNIYIKYKSSK